MRRAAEAVAVEVVEGAAREQELVSDLLGVVQLRGLRDQVQHGLVTDAVAERRAQQRVLGDLAARGLQPAVLPGVPDEGEDVHVPARDQVHVVLVPLGDVPVASVLVELLDHILVVRWDQGP